MASTGLNPDQEPRMPRSFEYGLTQWGRRVPQTGLGVGNRALMDRKLDRAIDRAVSRLVKTIASDRKAATQEFTAAMSVALRLIPNAVVMHDDTGREFLDREQITWLIEQVLARLAQRVQRQSGVDEVTRRALAEIFTNIMSAVHGRFDSEGIAE